MSARRSLLYSILTTKCPRCREGNMFLPGSLYTPRFARMHPRCACCGQSFEPEPGYYFGAMFVSYAISTAIFLVALFVLSLLADEITMLMVFVTVVGVVVGLLPIIFRLSRSLWISIFIHYEGPCEQIKKR
ncbi:DUF983 domain-containing protein [Cesiribacter andamanensis]|uniref:DUF983 domain-containing protein n=1 Tax=Cesiribacter andamanensis AMV16 TaxID=1279009 RepID=M7NNR6_9BACT|nr:DUF983 domain-containing protein [Cesiribacter andamanensis]EMR03355.1 hypothetical protein ADICEAN_01533 [Cesiribacter andamanensis AMV16]